MTNSTIHGSKIQLWDRWPGRATILATPPTDGFTGADHHNVAAAKYPVGTKIQVYDTTNKGYATFIYLQYIAGTAASGIALAARSFVCPQLAANATAGNNALPTFFKVTDDASEALIQGPVAVALSAMTTLYYGWFWCDGVCPVDFVPALLTSTYVTDGNVIAGALAVLANPSGSYDTIVLGFATTGAAHATSVVDKIACGVALKADT